MSEMKPVAWMDDGTTRSGSDSTSYRVVTDATKRDMPDAAARNFDVPLYNAATIAALKAENERLREALRPFARIADMEEKTPAGDSTLVNIDWCRAARAALTKQEG